MNKTQKPLKEQVIVITGASSGIGLCTAKMAAEGGACVVLVARQEQALQEAAAEIQAKGGQAIYVIADVAYEADVYMVGARAMKKYGRIDTWVNDAGVAIYGTIAQTDVADMRRLFDVNVWGMVYGCRVALEHLRQSGGTIINLGSVESEIALPLNGAYAASKHAVKAFTDVLRMEIEKENLPIHVTLIKPSGINTPFFEHAKNYLEGVPQPPPPAYAPEAVAEAILACTEQPVREIFIGGAGKMQSVMKSVAPGLTDKLLGLTMFSAQTKTNGSVSPQEDSLYEPPEHSGRIEGQRSSWPVLPRSLWTYATLYPVRTTVAVGAAWMLGRSFLRKKVTSPSSSRLWSDPTYDNGANESTAQP